MPLNPNQVPPQLFSFFQDGGARQLLKLAERNGTGLPLSNAIRRMFPNKAGVPNDFYQQLVGWMTSFTGQAVRAGTALSGLGRAAAFPESLIPSNFFLRRPDDQLANTFFNVQWTSLNPATGATKTLSAGKWLDITEGMQMGTITDLLIAQLRSELDAVSASARANARYRIISFDIFAAIQL
jgi:hypothetical protein